MAFFRFPAAIDRSPIVKFNPLTRLSHLQAYIKTKAECKLQFVPAPIMMGHVEGNGDLGAIWARGLQAERHLRGMADTAYALKFRWTGGPSRGVLFNHSFSPDELRT